VHVDSYGSTWHVLTSPPCSLAPVARESPARNGALDVRAYGRTDGPSQVSPRSYLVFDAEGDHGDGHFGGSLLASERPIFSNKRHFAESAA